MKVPAQGKVWSVPDPEATYGADARYLLGCGRCKSTCCTADPCKCCRAYKTRAAGGQLNFYPEDDNGHRQIMTMAEFRHMYESDAA
jgi:hypothetical protein